ncbi:type II toxin-antitoxin system YoeB family toxin [Candidatus Tisiphia endosymbiont of Melanophora roralis]|uniref:type II toxin-antitoxin system YoeB family toxin n=1 Tax=Candidatus Tisiphia endosymbiont of Melanophora roralis TaxID=3066261 RepID=UPI003977A18E
MKNNPRPISSEKLVGNLKGCYSLRINIKHRLIYEIFEDEKTVLIISLSGHYE